MPASFKENTMRKLITAVLILATMLSATGCIFSVGGGGDGDGKQALEHRISKLEKRVSELEQEVVADQP